MKRILFLFSLAGFSLNVNSQVYNAGTPFSMYYDITPDTLLNYDPFTSETYSMNLFGSTLADIEITAHGAVSSGGSDAYIRITSLDPNVYISFERWDSVFSPGDNAWNVTKVALPLNAGDQVNASNATWDNTVLYLTDHSGHGGGNKNVNDWVGGEKFVGLKYQNGATVEYGWIRLQCTTQDSCYVKDFSSTLTSSGITEATQPEIIVYPNPSNSCLYIKNINTPAFNISELKLRDIYAREIKFNYEIKGNDVKIDLDKNLLNGCYFLEYFSQGNKFSKKILKTND